MIFLQVAPFYQSDNDWRTLLILGSVVTGIILLLAIGNRLSSGRASRGGRQMYGWGPFRREARQIGLSKPEIKLLESFIKTYKVRRPLLVLSNSQELNSTLGKALRDVEHMKAPEQAVQERKYDIYQIKQKVDRFLNQNNRLSSTQQLILGQNITFQEDNGERYTSVITANLKEFFCTQIPVSRRGEPIRWKKGTKTRLFLWGNKDEEMVFESKVIGYSTVKKISSIILQHSKRVRKAVQRRYRRRKIKATTYIYPIRIVEAASGRKTKRQAMVMQNMGALGAMMDISIGGCAISTNKPFHSGDLVKVSFEAAQGGPVVTYGKVLDTRKASRTKSILHVMFTQASIKNLNKINAYIYSFH